MCKHANTLLVVAFGWRTKSQETGAAGAGAGGKHNQLETFAHAGP